MGEIREADAGGSRLEAAARRVGGVLLLNVINTITVTIIINSLPCAVTGTTRGDATGDLRTLLGSVVRVGTAASESHHHHTACGSYRMRIIIIAITIIIIITITIIIKIIFNDDLYIL